MFPVEFYPLYFGILSNKKVPFLLKERWAWAGPMPLPLAAIVVITWFLALRNYVYLFQIKELPDDETFSFSYKVSTITPFGAAGMSCSLTV